MKNIMCFLIRFSVIDLFNKINYLCNNLMHLEKTIIENLNKINREISSSIYINKINS